MQELIRHNDERIDELECAMAEAALNEDSEVFFVDCPLNHFFYHGLYVRQILMPKTEDGTLITSKVHKTCHPYRVLQGVVWVKIDNGEWERIAAPYAGTTYAGTRRELLIEENTVWETFHALPFITGDEGNLNKEKLEEVLDRIENTILEPYENKALGGVLSRNKLITQQTENQ